MASASLILIVDDHSATRSFIRELIGVPGREFVECSNGAKAVGAFAEHHPDWVVMDVEMPEMDGLSATRAICSAHPAARIVIVTQHDEPRLRSEAQAAGARAFLAKDDLLKLPDLLVIS